MRLKSPAQQKSVLRMFIWAMPVVMFSANVLAETNSKNCQGMRPPHVLPQLETPLDLKPDTTYVLADEVNAKDKNVYSFSGDVRLFKDDISLFSNQVTYKESEASIDATGDVSLVKDGAHFFSRHLFYQTEMDKGQLEDVEFVLNKEHARGKAGHIEIVNDHVTELYASSFTTCEEDKPAWQLHASHLSLDTQENVGIAKNTWIEFMRVPIFYMSYMSFPLKGRKTGFLPPTIGGSSQLGTEISVPYYFNIAPNRDATLVFNNFSDRGQRLDGEFRFLNKYDQGQINAEYLPDDDVIKEDRKYIAFAHSSSYLPRLTTKIDFRQVSDDDYFTDFGNKLSTTSISHLERKAEASYRGDNWSLRASVLDFQTLEESIPDSSRPYKKLPELNFFASAPREYYYMRPEIKADYVQFKRNGRVSGGRLDIQPSLSMPFRGGPGFFIPKVALRHTAYSLENQAAGADDSPTRTLPVYSLDSGLVFERDSQIGKRKFIQTLEPRLFYLNVPFEDQSNLVIDENGSVSVFDTANSNQSFAQLFAENRFTGADRVGDANQLSFALTTRFLDQSSGVENFSASIGRTYFYEDRLVTLPGQLPQTNKKSDIYAELRSKPLPSMNINARIQWNSQASETRNGNFQFQYIVPNSQILNLGYIFDRNDLGDIVRQETDISLLWPINHNWSFIGRRNYNLLENREEERLAGIEYDSCCWAFRIVSRRHFAGDQLGNSRSTMFELELKGLSSIGKDVKSLLQNNQYGISGY